MNSRTKKLNTQSADRDGVPSDPRERGYWVSYQLKLRDQSYGKIASSIKKTPAAVRQALFQPSFEVEKKLANVLGLTPEELFPERYDDEGMRRYAVRLRK